MKTRICLLYDHIKSCRYFGVMVSVFLFTIAGCNSKKSTPEKQKVDLQENQNNAESAQINTLTKEEKKEGWRLLFDGKTTEGWRGAYKEGFPEKGWRVEDGLLKTVSSGGGESESGGDILTEDQFSSFEISLEFKLTKGANSGIKYFVKETYPEPEGSAIGLEYQLIDDNRPDVEGTWTLASLYELYKAKNKNINPIVEFNKARILVEGKHVEHWLNGLKVLEYIRGSEDFQKRVSKSKYKDYENFGEVGQGHILLQEHGSEVAFKNIKIREIDPSESE